MLDATAFLAEYPEFTSVSTSAPGLLTAKLAAAAASIGNAWGDLGLEDKGHGLLTAHLLALTPNGKPFRLQTDDADSTYGKQYRDLRVSVAAQRPDMRVL